MIRPLTCICFLMASGSGLYLYQSKHAAQLLDRTIEKTVHDTDLVREQTRALRTEWTLLNEPERLRQLADLYLPTLKSVAPGQFTSMADLDSRLPPVRVIPPQTSPVPEGQPVDPALGEPIAGDLSGEAVAGAFPVPPVPPSQSFVLAANAAAALAAAQSVASQNAPVAAPQRVGEQPAARVTESQPARVTEQPTARVVERKLAVSPRPMDPRPVVLHASWSRPVDVRPSEQRPADPRQAEIRPVEARPVDSRSMEARPVEARPMEARPVEARPVEARAVESRPVEARSAEPRLADARPAEPRPTAGPVARPVRVSTAAAPVASAPPQRGSLLGMAHASQSGPVQAPVPRPIPVNAWSSQTPTGG
jgi:hypothetical protein